MTKPIQPDTKKLEDITKQQSYFVAKRNDLIQKAGYTDKTGDSDKKDGSLSTVQSKALLYLISKIKPNDSGEEKYYISLTDFCRVCDIDHDAGKNLSDAKRALKAIADKSVWIRQGKNEILLRWLDHVEWIDDQQCFEVSFTRDMIPDLYGLINQGKYIRYSLENVLPMDSKYSIHLYELLKSYEKLKPEVEFSIDELRERLDAEAYTRYPDFKRRVLETAIRDINEYSDIEVTYTPIQGKNRATEFIRFSVRCPEEMELWSRLVRRTFRKQQRIENKGERGE